MLAEIRAARFLALEFAVARPEIADEVNIDPFGNEPAADFFFCQMSLSFSNRFADKIMCNIFPILVILVHRDKVSVDFDEYSGLLADLADAAFFEFFIAFDASAGREELFVDYLVTDQYLSVFNYKTAARRADPLDFG